MYICICRCICIYIYIYIYICICICICTHTCVCTCTCTYAYMHMYIHIHVHVHTRVYIYIYMYIYTGIYRCIYIYIYTYSIVPRSLARLHHLGLALLFAPHPLRLPNASYAKPMCLFSYYYYCAIIDYTYQIIVLTIIVVCIQVYRMLRTGCVLFKVVHYPRSNSLVPLPDVLILCLPTHRTLRTGCWEERFHTPPPPGGDF